MLTMVFSAQPLLAVQSFEDFLDIKGSDPNIQIQSFSVPEKVRHGDQFQIYVRVTIGESWHIYSMHIKDHEPSLPTQIRFDQNVFKAEGDWRESAPRLVMDEVLQKALKTHQGQVEFHRLHSVPSNLKPGVHHLSGILLFRACDNKICALQSKMPFRLQIEILGKK
ncbi:MAG: hypothetical protein IIA62_05670 [Nitrospinae bacterium]|nr:hypothetical protein [Nitrospinota bacterium]